MAAITSDVRWRAMPVRIRSGGLRGMALSARPHAVHAVTDFAVRLDDHRPRCERDLEDGLVDGVGAGHADRVRQPPAPLREPDDELMRAASGVGTDQRPASWPVLPRQLEHSELTHGDVVGGGIAGCVARPEQAGHRLCAATASVIDEPPSEDGGRSSSSRSRWRPASRSGTAPGPRPGPRSPCGNPGPHSWPRSDMRTRLGPRGPYRELGLRPGHGEGIDESGDGRGGDHRSEPGGSARSILTPARQSPPRAAAKATSAGSCSDRAPPRTSPRRQRRRHCLVRLGLTDRLDQPYGSGLGHHRMTAALNTWIGTDTLSTWEVPPTAAGTKNSTILIPAAQRRLSLPDHPSDGPFHGSTRLQRQAQAADQQRVHRPGG